MSIDVVNESNGTTLGDDSDRCAHVPQPDPQWPAAPDDLVRVHIRDPK